MEWNNLKRFHFKPLMQTWRGFWKRFSNVNQMRIPIISWYPGSVRSFTPSEFGLLQISNSHVVDKFSKIFSDHSNRVVIIQSTADLEVFLDYAGDREMTFSVQCLWLWNFEIYSISLKTKISSFCCRILFLAPWNLRTMFEILSSRLRLFSFSFEHSSN